MLLGGAAAALAISVQSDRTTLTRYPPPGVERTLESVVRVQASLPAPAPSPVVAMDEVLIVGKRRVAAAAPVPRPVEFGPCSEWRDLGPKALADSLSVEQHRVRALCLTPR